MSVYLSVCVCALYDRAQTPLRGGERTEAVFGLAWAHRGLWDCMWRRITHALSDPRPVGFSTGRHGYRLQIGRYGCKGRVQTSFWRLEEISVCVCVRVCVKVDKNMLEVLLH